MCLGRVFAAFGASYAIFRVTHSSHFAKWCCFFFKQTNSHFANFCLATSTIFPTPNKINFSSFSSTQKILGKPCTATPCTQATRWRSVWAAKNVHSGDSYDARWIGPWHERPLPASPVGRWGAVSRMASFQISLAFVWFFNKSKKKTSKHLRSQLLPKRPSGPRPLHVPLLWRWVLALSGWDWQTSSWTRAELQRRLARRPVFVS